MFIKIRTKCNEVIYVNTNDPDFYISTGHYTCQGNFYYFKLFEQWFSYNIFGQAGEFKTSEQAEKVAETIINSIIDNVKLLDLNAVIENVKNNAC